MLRFSVNLAADQLNQIGFAQDRDPTALRRDQSLLLHIGQLAFERRARDAEILGQRSFGFDKFDRVRLLLSGLLDEVHGNLLSDGAERHEMELAAQACREVGRDVEVVFQNEFIGCKQLQDT